MSQEIRGVLPVLHLPFDSDDEIEWPILRREVDWAFEVGCDGVCAAMVSEVLRLTIEERVALTNRLVEMVDDRGAVIISVGAESVHQAVELGLVADSAGASAVMAIPPTSCTLSRDALWAYYSGIAEQVELPLIVQDASSYVGSAMSIDFQAHLLDHFGCEKILFKPEAPPIGPNLSALRNRTEGRAKIMDGSGGILLMDAYRRGITGTMPGTDLLDGIVALWRALEAKDEQTAYRIYFPICALVALQMQAGLDGFLAIEKYLLVKRGIFTNARRRQPYSWELDEETRQEVDILFSRLMKELELANG
jgi:2-keto-3-deoxy-L-arabinonate dehydratase